MRLFPFFFLILLSAGCSPTVVPLPRAHAHNDYEHTRPLFDALENGFTSVEADVHLIDGELYVAHDRPANVDRTRTLEELYLSPLREHIRKNEGRVYKGYDDFFYLMVDFKTAAAPTYEALIRLLANYGDVISTSADSANETHKPVKVFISGDRPVSQVLADPVKYAALDGRPEDLGKGIPAAIMPVISENYSRFMRWKGEGTPDAEEMNNLRRLVTSAHAERKKVRLWGAPDHPEAWRLLSDLGVDLINTDRLTELKAFLLDGSARSGNY